MPKRLWKRCMEFVVKNSTGNLEKYFIDPETGTVHKVDNTMSNNSNGNNKDNKTITKATTETTTTITYNKLTIITATKKL